MLQNFIQLFQKVSESYGIIQNVKKDLRMLQIVLGCSIILMNVKLVSAKKVLEYSRKF